MADQVIPTGSLAPGLPLALLAAPKRTLPLDRPRVVRPADVESQRPADGPQDASSEALDAAIQAFKDYLQQSGSDLQFQVDESTGRLYFKLVDTATQEVIRQVPSDEILAMARKLREISTSQGASGVLVDKEG